MKSKRCGLHHFTEYCLSVKDGNFEIILYWPGSIDVHHSNKFIYMMLIMWSFEIEQYLVSQEFEKKPSFAKLMPWSVSAMISQCHDQLVPWSASAIIQGVIFFKWPSISWISIKQIHSNLFHKNSILNRHTWLNLFYYDKTYIPNMSTNEQTFKAL